MDSKLSPFDSALIRKCNLPTKLPPKLTQADVEKYWATDRTNLVKCGLSKDALIKALKARKLI